ncbi:MAG: ABC transporter permease [Tissierellia bacterium]|nr:ABC transporter permease [Tissierellia bacterium]
MRAYLTFFKIRFINGLQYRAAAYAGVATQFAWGAMTILMFSAFYKTNADNFPMTFEKLTTYIWLQQSFLALFMAWFFDNEIFDSISNGNVAYELCRPTKLYEMWFIRSLSSRVYRVVLRCAPILIVAAFLPSPYGISLPVDIMTFFLFLLSLIFGAFLMVSINMLIYISTFYTISSMGIRVLAISLIELLSGAIIPIPFLPDNIQQVFYLLPFASTQNTPFLIYNGYLTGSNIYYALFLQTAWLLFFVLLGKLLINKALKNIVVQGG